MLTDKQMRIVLFLIGCMGIRSLFVIIAKMANTTILPYLGSLALLPAIGFFYNFFIGSRKADTGLFGGPVWWKNLRPIHGLLYSLFAYNAINKNTNAWIYLLVDVLVGLVSFSWYYLTH